ncbi:hypothetical protein COCCU_09900 [Corynebacterium occultum]|uniref:Uncharacterized protein n=1 Tax=Corynebacterium occultum TaxID=2675219 RepID=A0A6B8VQQ7_9CORY|nr:hypothetical protein [Corynebacterium occultum]QGU07902.1 hypothetical protein COCCU_09900 [Corynebacterium occultum]
MINMLSGSNPTGLPADLMSAERQWAGFGMPESPKTTKIQPTAMSRPLSWASQSDKDELRSALLSIRRLPRHLRATVESAMVVCIQSPAEPCAADVDLLTARWFTAWRRCLENHRRVECQEVITGTTRELGYLRGVLANLSQEHDFDAEVRPLD